MSTSWQDCHGVSWSFSLYNCFGRPGRSYLYPVLFLSFMKFAHLADVHVGAWRDPKLAALPDRAFDLAVSTSLEEEVDFIVIAGDLFNTALPGMDHLRAAVRSLQRAKEAGVPVYVIPGSHDFSPSGKSMLHVLEEAGLLVDVFKGEIVDGRLRLSLTRDEKTGAVLTGVLGRRGMLERREYEDLDKGWLSTRLPSEKPKVFLFHTSLSELKPKELGQMESSPVSMMPPGFDYYAGGHVHVTEEVSLDGYPHVVYPGPLFPASFSELEKLGRGGMVVVEDGVPRRVPLELKRVVSISVVARGERPEDVSERLREAVKGKEVEDAIVLLRVSGTLVQGTARQVDVRGVMASLRDRGAYAVLRNTSGLRAEQAEAVEVEEASTEAIEERVLKASLNGSAPFEDQVSVARSLLHGLGLEKAEGETNASYDERVVSEAKRLLGIE